MPPVAVARVQINLPGSRSLKEKRAVLRALLDRLRRRFNVSAAEVGVRDAHQLAEIGIAVVSDEASVARRLLDEAVHFLETSVELDGRARVLRVETGVR
ncbi:MAG: DUF503 domain-containing protein [Clostridia bacterium]|nr:DUF503 domain-containing protein [Clostridia bacterium]